MELLPLALSRPGEALARARAVLAALPVRVRPLSRTRRWGSSCASSVTSRRGSASCAWQCGWPAPLGQAEREADVLATLGVGLVYAGRTAAGLAAFDRAVSLSDGVLKAQVLYRRSTMLWTLGRHPAALEDAQQAIAVLSRAGDKSGLLAR